MSDNDATQSAQEPTPCMFMVHGEQLMLLRDMFALDTIDVCLVDTSMTALIEDAWKPWARRLRPHTKHISGRLILCAPACIFPDPQNNSTIRNTLATQLQAICDIAVTLEAHAVLIPIEAGLACFAARITHYLTPLHQRVTDQGMSLIVHAGIGSDVDDLNAILANYEPAITLSTDEFASGTYHVIGAEAPTTVNPIPIMGPFDEVTRYRSALQTWQSLRSSVEIPATDDSTPHEDTPDAATAE